MSDPTLTAEQIAEMDIEEDVLHEILASRSYRGVPVMGMNQMDWRDLPSPDLKTRSQIDIDDLNRSGDMPVISTPDLDQLSDLFSPAIDSIELDSGSMAVVESQREAYQCQSCKVHRPAQVHTSTAIGDTDRRECYGPCQEKTAHERTGRPWQPSRLEFRCPRCEYETLMWEDPDEWPPECSECPPEPEGSDGIPVVPSRDVDLDGLNGAIDATEVLGELTEVSGIGEGKGMALMKAGYHSKEDLRRVSQQDLADIDEFDMALAARVKADVGDASDTEMMIINVRFQTATDD